MTYARQQIRDAVATAVTGLKTTRRRVYKSRVYDVNNNEIPGLLIFTNRETDSASSMGKPRRLTHQLEVLVEGYVKLTQGYDDLLDTIAAEVTVALYNNASLQALVKDILLTSTEKKIVGTSEKPVGVISMIFTTVYRTVEGAPETIIS